MYQNIRGASAPREIGRRLLWLRERFSMTQADFADSIDMAEKRYANWENGNARLSLNGALVIREAYEIPLDFLFLGRREYLRADLMRSWDEWSRNN